MLELTRDDLVDLGGWAVLKEAKALVEAKRVKSLQWEDKVLSGVVETGATQFFPRLNLRTLTFAENRCNCSSGRRGIVCAHAIALCLVSMEGGLERPETEENHQKEIEKADDLMKTLMFSDEKGIPARFRVLLPPNLAVAAQKDRIMVKVEFELASGSIVRPETIDRGRAYRLSPCQQILGARIEKLCGEKLHGMLQLTRHQLSDLLDSLKGEPDVFWVNRADTPIPWVGDELLGVHDHLNVPDISPEDSWKETTPRESTKVTPITSALKTPIESSLTPPEVDGSTNFLAIRLPGRDSSVYFPLLELLKGAGFILEPGNGRWWLRDRHKTLNFLSDYYATLKDSYGAVFTENFRQRLADLKSLDIHAEANAVGDDYELRIELGADVPSDELQRELSKGKRYLERDGKILLVDKQKLDALNQVASRISGDHARAWNTRIRLKAKAQDLADLENVLDSSSIHFTPPEEWQSRSAALRNLSHLAEAPVPEKTNEILRLYQKIGVAWMHHLYRHRLAGILADEMGLGKTVQAIALIQAIRKQETGMALVVCPAGLVGNWRRELLRFAPELRVSMHHGVGRSAESGSWSELYDVVITSYSTLSLDEALFRKHVFSVIVGDEAQHIKNRRTRHAKSLKRLEGRARFLLTGTPIENSMEDLVSLLEFLLPGYLKKPVGQLSADDRAWYQQRIRERTAPYLLRRTKRQVAPELPEKIEQVVYCEMESAQKALYDQMQRRSAEHFSQLENRGASEGQLKMAAFTELLRLRQICADPRLVEAREDPAHSAKLQAFREILEEAMDDGHRILVFSQFVSLLKLLREDLDRDAVPYCYIDGSTRDRLAEADRFNNNENIPVFLISLKAGGTGLNLTGADTVVHYDPWWNPAAEAQATDRAHRIGQERTVTSIRLIVSGSVEEKVETLQRQKQQLLKSLFEESESALGELKLAEIRDLLFSN